MFAGPANSPEELQDALVHPVGCWRVELQMMSAQLGFDVTTYADWIAFMSEQPPIKGEPMSFVDLCEWATRFRQAFYQFVDKKFLSEANCAWQEKPIELHAELQRKIGVAIGPQRSGAHLLCELAIRDLERMLEGDVHPGVAKEFREAIKYLRSAVS